MQQGERMARPTAAVRALRKQLAQPDQELARKAEKEVAKPTAVVRAVAHGASREMIL